MTHPRPSPDFYELMRQLAKAADAMPENERASLEATFASQTNR